VHCQGQKGANSWPQAESVEGFLEKGQRAPSTDQEVWGSAVNSPAGFGRFGAVLRPQMHFGRIKSPENASNGWLQTYLNSRKK